MTILRLASVTRCTSTRLDRPQARGWEGAGRDGRLGGETLAPSTLGAPHAAAHGARYDAVSAAPHAPERDGARGNGCAQLEPEEHDGMTRRVQLYWGKKDFRMAENTLACCSSLVMSSDWGSVWSENAQVLRRRQNRSQWCFGKPPIALSVFARTSKRHSDRRG